jgi:uncharacterized protein
MKKARLLIIVMAFLLVAPAACALDVPYLTGRVNDHATIINEDTRRSLSDLIKVHEDRTGNQIAVLTIPSLDGESIEDYASSVFEAWKLGQKGKDNGLLVIVAPRDRRMRIEVGYGLEGVMPDGLAGDIIRNVMTPRFKTDDYSGGIEAGVNAVIQVLEGGGAADIAGSTDGGNEAPSIFGSLERDPDLSLTERILLGAFIFGIIGMFTVLGILTPGAGWFLYVFLIPFWAMFPIVVLGSTVALYLLIAYLIGYPIAKLLIARTAWYGKAKKDLRDKGTASIGGFVISSGGAGGSWSSGDSGGGGFSGGGGSSGGGGASGGW